MPGTGELIVILVVILILFGGKKLPEFARSIGLGIREFKKACYGIEEEENKKPSDSSVIEVEVEPKSKEPS